MTARMRHALGRTTALTTALTTGLTTALTTALTVLALVAPAAAAPPPHGVAAAATSAVQAAPTPPAVAELGKDRGDHRVRNRMVDVWTARYGPAAYRHVRYTRSGTVRADLAWRSHGSAPAAAVAFCGFLSRWYPAATTCLIDVLRYYWAVADAIDRAIRTGRCLITLTRRSGPLPGAPRFVAGTVRCAR